MAILRELWTKEVPDSEVKSTYQYVVDLQERLDSKQPRENNLRCLKNRLR